MSLTKTTKKKAEKAPETDAGEATPALLTEAVAVVASPRAASGNGDAPAASIAAPTADAVASPRKKTVTAAEGDAKPKKKAVAAPVASETSGNEAQTAPVAAVAAPAPVESAEVKAEAPRPTPAPEAIVAKTVPANVAPAPAASAAKDDGTAETSEEDEPTAPEEPAAAFRVLNLSEPLMRAIIEAGFEAPTPIQAQAIPILLTGQDMIGQAQTGTGKTAAFALPLGERLDPTLLYPQAIVLLPTRELCIQVAQETHNLYKYRRLRVVPVYGGQPIDRQFRALSQGAQIVVGTPGRVLDHLRRGTLDLSRIKAVVLDEADEMLNMGFLEDVEEILKNAPKERQTALFSATMPPRIAALAREYLKDPVRVAIENKRRTVAQVTQTYYEVIPSQKMEALARILDMESPGSTILFCRTRREVDELGENLQMRGYEAETLHGDMNQSARDRVMNRFRSGAADLLIATDVAARGLDIDQVTHVINYDIPWDVESYIHRIGRTGRAGRTGDAITLVSPRERHQIKFIERLINAPIRPARVPTAADIAARRRDVFKEKLRETLAGNAYDGHLITVEELTSEGDYDASQIAAATLHLLWQAQKGAGEYDVAEAAAEGERAEPGMTRLFIQIGRMDGVRPGDIVGAIANEAGLPGNAIGAIDIMDNSTFVEVPEAAASRVIEALSQTKLRGKRVLVDVARPRREDGDFEGNNNQPGGGFGGPRGNAGHGDRPDNYNRPPRPGYGRDDRGGYGGRDDRGGYNRPPRPQPGRPQPYNGKKR